VVVGGGLAGMLAARVLSDHFDAVTLLERDRFPEAPAARKGLPHGRHAHALLERGRGILERFLPGLTGELARAGAAPLDFTRDVAWLSRSAAWSPRCEPEHHGSVSGRLATRGRGTPVCKRGCG
jgi:flavin-dependent dehydrogenase